MSVLDYRAIRTVLRGCYLVREVDVCILGAGPAGLAAAVQLRRNGRDVIVLDRPPVKKPWGGETFTGTIQTTLKELGFWDRFETAGHLPGYERVSAWGGEPHTESSIMSTTGNVWHVDRDQFDLDLRRDAEHLGVPILSYLRIDCLERSRGKWSLRLDSTSEVLAPFLIDSTGRSRVLAKKLGAPVRATDWLMGLTCRVEHSERSELIPSMTLEATPYGWWYAAPTPAGHVVALFTDRDLAPPELRKKMQPVAANSAFTEWRPEDGWLPIGDACASHDPLCGWGVVRAMRNAMLAADAVSCYLSTGSLEALCDYQEHCQSQFQKYLQGLTARYSMEQRWSDSPFWGRRITAV